MYSPVGLYTFCKTCRALHVLHLCITNPDTCQLGNLTTPKQMKFQRKFKGGGSFPIQKSILEIFANIDDISVMNSGKTAIQLSKNEEGGRGSFGTFQKIIFFRGGGGLPYPLTSRATKY